MASCFCFYQCGLKLKPQRWCFLFIRPSLSTEKKINIVHLVFVGIHEQEISASSAELFRRDPQRKFTFLTLHCLALNITNMQTLSNFQEMMQAYQFLEFLL